MRLVSLFIFTILLVLPNAYADLRDAYTVRDIPVSEQADSVVAAQEKAFNAARVVGAKRIIQRLTLAEDRAKVPDIYPDAEAAQLMSASIDVQDEAAGGGVYRGVLSTIMNPNMVRQHLSTRGVPFVDQQAPLTLLVPVAGGNTYFGWVAALPEAEKASLTPFVTASLGRYSSDADWAIVSTEAQQMGAERAVLAELSGASGSWRVKLTLLTPAGRQGLGRTGQDSSLGATAQSIIGVLENNWKRQNIARDTGARQITQADVSYTSLIEWNTIRKAFVNSSQVYDFDVLAQNRSSAIVRITHSTDINRVERDLLQRGVRLAPASSPSEGGIVPQGVGRFGRARVSSAAFGR